MAAEKGPSKAGKACGKVKSALNLKKRFSKMNIRDEDKTQKTPTQKAPTQEQKGNERTRQCKDVFNEAERALNEGGIEYGVVGGAALYTYGQLRMTKDLDILVPKGQVRRARHALRDNSGGRFNWDRAYSHDHMWYELAHRCVNIDVVSPEQLDLPQNFLETQNGARITHHGRRLVNPHGILQMKRLALQSRTSAHDAEDIEWLEENMEQLDREIAPQGPRGRVSSDAARQGPRQ
ncbi:hypothetical protein CNMCM5793_005631 [Aspergillus hiratsukae]|uniref:Uncharacterized protein n=1 Tax=Aspergillus hiratsukae TaxID=1194566 RepID=A0A8H6QF61_9EURO|nr:hypothetical protein CNMCM5793_005631 [Aspergillus hiratsukae]KAF7171971.1 hypothetical protein CNMCM6106_006277 [Aspergillus hiratsukae]